MARTMLLENHLPLYFWAEAVSTSCYILNRITIRKYLDKTPYELLYGKKPSIKYFKTFGCKCFILNTLDNLDKFDAKSDEGIFLDYSSTCKAYRVFNKRTLVVQESMHVTFDESNVAPKLVVVENDIGLQDALRKLDIDEQTNLEEDDPKEDARVESHSQSQELPKDWRFIKDHPREQIIGDVDKGTAVVIVMLVTTFLMIPIMLLVWRSHWILVTLFTGLSLFVELTYFSAVLLKIDQGGWVPLVIAGTFLVIMYVWHYATVKRYEFEVHGRVSMAWILGLGPGLGLVRVPGIGFVYTDLASGVPHIFSHFITNLPAIHSVVAFVCVKYLPVYTVPVEERILVKRIGPKSFRMFRCVARYGYKDVHKKDDDFEKMLFESILVFVQLENMMEGYSDSEEYTISSQDSIMRARSCGGGTEGDEIEFLNRCRDAGVVHILGNTIVRARRDSGIVKRVAIDYVYAFLSRICRENSVIFNVPHESLLNVGQIFYV